MATASASSGHLPKRRRVTQACDYCHQRSIRCRPAENDNRGRCSNCIDFSQACTRNRVVKRRGARPRQEQAQVIGHASPTQASSAISNTGATKHIASPVTCVPWSAPFVATQASVVDLVEVYVEIVYPIFPLFHRASFLRRISRAEFNHDQYLFAVTMAVCALTSARANDNALFNPVWDKESLLSTASDSFYNAAIAALPKTESPDQNLDLLRAYALLSLAAMQYGRTREMQAFLGRYHTLVAMDGLHNESNWPQGLTMIEMEERRRLYWSMYTLDVFSCLVFDSLIHTREEQSHVQYPTELDDAFFDNVGYQTDSHPSYGAINSPDHGSTVSWLCGYNITTDLWRLLEHATIKLQGLKSRTVSVDHMAAKLDMSPSVDALRVEMDRIRLSLPSQFLATDEMTGTLARDLNGFQAANIVATMQLLRIVLLSSEQNTIEQRCQVVSEVVDAFMRIPSSYLRAISCPLLHHLGGIGSVLGGVLEESLTSYQYQQVRTVLMALAQLLENLDLGFHSVRSSSRLRALVSQVDVRMVSDPMNTETSSSPVREIRQGNTYSPEDFLVDWPWKSSFT